MPPNRAAYPTISKIRGLYSDSHFAIGCATVRMTFSVGTAVDRVWRNGYSRVIWQTTEGWIMAVKQILCLQNENVFQAFARAVKTGVFPANAQLFPLKMGVPQPNAPAGYVTVGSILIR